MSNNLQTHPLVDKISERPDQPPEVLPLIGFLGPSHRLGYRRVYSDLSLNTFMEVPDDAISSVEPTNPNNPNSPTLILVKAGTQVQTQLANQHQVEAGFLNGNIARNHLPGVGGDPGWGNQIRMGSLWPW